MDKRFLRFGRSDAEPDLDDMIRMTLARAEAEGIPLYRRKKRSTAETLKDTSDKAASSSDHPEGMAKREAEEGGSPVDDGFGQDEKRFMRFGRSGQENEEAMSDDKRFMRFGKRFMRFGRGGQEDEEPMAEDKRFMRFGKRFMRFGRNSEDDLEVVDSDDQEKNKRFMRFGKRFMRFGRGAQENGDDMSDDKRFMRFGKRFMLSLIHISEPTRPP